MGTNDIKRPLPFPLFGLFAFASLLASAQAQFFAIDWFTTDGGGGVSSGGGYVLSGTVGQHNAGEVLSGGTFTLTGGFWAGVSAAEPLPPLRLRVEISDTEVLLAWPHALAGYQLEETGELTEPGTGWTPVAQTPALVGSENQVRLPLSGPGRMFWLRRSHP